jgi:hypothetical protein
MKSRIILATIAGVMLAAFCATNTHAQAPANVAGLLSEAYADLDHADHDYKGHRMRAMKQIEAAGKLLKVNLGGDGRGHEKQGVSDEQLAAAQGLLTQIQSQLAGEKKSRVLHHVNKALEELTTALKVK